MKFDHMNAMNAFHEHSNKHSDKIHMNIYLHELLKETSYEYLHECFSGHNFREINITFRLFR